MIQNDIYFNVKYIQCCLTVTASLNNGVIAIYIMYFLRASAGPAGKLHFITVQPDTYATFKLITSSSEPAFRASRALFNK
jgi:hypothetical protein